MAGDVRFNRTDVKGFVLKTTYSEGNKLKRTIFQENVLFEKINKYIPPLFLTVYYDTSYFLERRDSSVSLTAEWDESVDSKTILYENIWYVKELLHAFQPYDVSISMLRLESVRNAQTDNFDDFPLPYTSIGALARISFNDIMLRNGALDVLWHNREVNGHVYNISFTANTSINTLVDWLEPLFSYVEKIQKPYNMNYDSDDTTSSLSGKSRKIKKTKRHTTDLDYRDLFEIDIQVFDNNDDHDDYGRNCQQELGAAVQRNVQQPGSSSASGNSRRRSMKKGNAIVIDPIAESKRRQNKTNVVIFEKPWSSGGSSSCPFNCHDVTHYFRNINKQNLTRLYSSQLESLPVVIVQMQQEYCSVTCCVDTIPSDRFGRKRTVKLSVYYCWDSIILESLRRLKLEVEKKDGYEKVAVEMFRNSSESLVQMLHDCRACFWKDNVSTYVRLTVSTENEEYLYGNYIFKPLWTGINEHVLPIQLEIETGLKKNGSFDLFSNAISLDADKMCNALGGRSKELDSEFIERYYALRDSYHTCPNNAVSVIKTDQSLMLHVLRSRHRMYTELVHSFKRNDMMTKLCEICKELGVGLLDVFGVNCWNDEQPGKTDKDHFIENNVNPKYRKRNVFENNNKTFSSFIENSVFINMLRKYSIHYSTNNNINQGNCSHVQSLPVNVSEFKGFYTRDAHKEKYCAYDIDLVSSYPSICKAFNVSPEHTVIISREKYNELKRRYECGDILKKTFYEISHSNYEYVIMSLKNSVYEGALSRYMYDLMMRRNAQFHTELRFFYKQITNVVKGCLTRRTSDLYAPQCAYSLTSMCKSLIRKIVQHVAQETIFVKTDGALILSSADNEQVLRNNINTSLDTFVIDHGIHVPFADNRPFSMEVTAIQDCIVLNNNTYIIRQCKNNTFKTVYSFPYLNNAMCHLSRKTINRLYGCILDGYNMFALKNVDRSFQNVLQIFSDGVLNNVPLIFQDVDIYSFYRLTDDILSLMRDNHKLSPDLIHLGYKLAIWNVDIQENDIRRCEERVNLPPLNGSSCKLDVRSSLYKLCGPWLRIFSESYANNYTEYNFNREFGMRISRISLRLSEYLFDQLTR